MNNFINYYIDNNKLVKRNTINKIFVFLYAIIKYILDRLIGIVLAIVLLPFMIIIAIIIKIDSKGPVFFKQKRTGKKGKSFTIYKYRTMINDVPTKFGSFLRKTSLDELPQIYSIIIGKMSFIGPRPWMEEYFYSMNIVQKHRYDVLPGLTGYAQVMGRNNITIFKKIDYDLEYIKKYSLWLDIKIIFMTIKTVISKQGVDYTINDIKNEIKELKRSNKRK